MKAIILAAVLACAFASPVYAQETNPFAWPKGSQKVAERISDATVWTNIVAQFVADLKADDKKHAFTASACRWGIALGTEALTKQFVHRLRPDGSNDHSFLSGHTENAFANSGWNLSVGIPLAAVTGYMRTAGNKHWPTDVLAGAAGGLLASKVCGSR